LKQTLTEGLNLIALNQGPFHYGSHYSNSGTVLHFLVRLPPFTSMFLCYQGSYKKIILLQYSLKSWLFFINLFFTYR